MVNDTDWARSSLNRADLLRQLPSAGRTVESNELLGTCATPFDPAAVPCPADIGWPGTLGRQTSAEVLGGFGVTAIKSARIVGQSAGGREGWASQTRYAGRTAGAFTTWLNGCHAKNPNSVVHADDPGHLVDYFQFGGSDWTPTSMAQVVDSVSRHA